MLRLVVPPMIRRAMCNVLVPSGKYLKEPWTGNNAAADLVDSLAGTKGVQNESRMPVDI
jgi:hypothetical protein